MRAEHENPNGGTVILGVCWYDEDFYNDRKVAWFGVMHCKVYASLGNPMENISVTHWRRDEERGQVPDIV